VSQEQTIYGQSTAAIILNGTDCVMGIVVDGVTDVISLDLDQMRPTLEFGFVIDIEYGHCGRSHVDTSGY